MKGPRWGFTNAKLSVDIPPQVPPSNLTLSSSAEVSHDNYIPVCRMEYLPPHPTLVSAHLHERLSTICNAAKGFQCLSFRVLNYDYRQQKTEKEDK